MSFKALIVLTFLLFARPQDFFHFLSPLRLSLLFIVITFFLTFSDKKTLPFPEVFKVREGKLFTLFYLVMLIGIPFAIHRGVAFSFIVFKNLPELLFFYLLVSNIHSYDKFKKILSVVSFSVFFHVFFSIVYGQFAHGRFFPPTMYDPNDLAYFLVALLPLFFMFITKESKATMKLFALVGISMSIIVVFLTGSRGGLLGLLFVVIFLVFSKIVIKKTAFKFAFLIIIVVAIALNADQINFDRLQTMTDLSSDYNVSDESGRLAVWKRGIRLVMADPLTGVGVVCFGKAIGEQRAADGVIPKWQTAHNSFLQVAAETGLIGFGLFVALLYGCLKNFRRHSLRVAQVGVVNLPGICLIGLCGAMVCGFFLSQGYSMIFTFFYALSCSLRNDAVQNEILRV